MNRYLTALSIAAIFLTVHNHALDIELDARAGVQFSTNSGRSSEDAIAEWIYTPGFLVRAEHDAPNMELQADYRFTRRIYQQDAFDDENVTTGTGRLHMGVIPGRLDFTFTNSRTESAIRSLNSASPDNRQQTTNSQAGPTLKFSARGKDEVQLQYLYGNRNSARTNNGAESHTGILRYVILPNSLNTYSLELIRQEVQFENVVSPDLRSNLAQIKWERENNVLNWSMVGGYKETERSLGREDVDAVVGELQFDWRLAQDTVLNLRASRDIRDQSQLLSFGSTEFNQQVLTDSDLNELFESTDIYMGITQRLGNTDFTFGVVSSEQDYEDAFIQRDTDSIGVLVTANRRLNRHTQLSTRVQFTEQDFTDENVQVDRLSGSVLITREFSKRLSASFGMFYDKSDSNSRLLENIVFDEWQGILRFDYTLYQ